MKEKLKKGNDTEQKMREKELIQYQKKSKHIS